jgi:hypothetical protein
MSASLSEQEHSIEISLVLQYIGYGLFGLFVAFLLKLVLPVALLQPAWQLQLANALRTTAIFPLLGAVLLLLAQLLRSQSRSLAGQVLWVRRLAFLAALGFLLLIPLQTSAGIKLAISRLPGAPAEIQGSFTKPINVVRSVVLDQLQPQIERADNRLAELRKLRLQGGLLGWITDGLAALALAVCFAAIGQLQSEGSSLLLHVLNLPGLIRFRLDELGKGRRSREPVDAAWFESLHDGDDAKPANLSDAEWAIIVSLRTGKTSAASSKARSGDNQGGAGSST